MLYRYPISAAQYFSLFNLTICPEFAYFYCAYCLVSWYLTQEYYGGLYYDWENVLTEKNMDEFLGICLYFYISFISFERLFVGKILWTF